MFFILWGFPHKAKFSAHWTFDDLSQLCSYRLKSGVLSLPGASPRSLSCPLSLPISVLHFFNFCNLIGNYSMHKSLILRSLVFLQWKSPPLNICIFLLKTYQLWLFSILIGSSSSQPALGINVLTAFSAFRI